jgi:hypothetical protein
MSSVGVVEIQTKQLKKWSGMVISLRWILSDGTKCLKLPAARVVLLRYQMQLRAGRAIRIRLCHVAPVLEKHMADRCHHKRFIKEFSQKISTCFMSAARMSFHRSQNVPEEMMRKEPEF